MACLECGYPLSEARYDYDGKTPHLGPPGNLIPGNLHEVIDSGRTLYVATVPHDGLTFVWCDDTESEFANSIEQMDRAIKEDIKENRRYGWKLKHKDYRILEVKKVLQPGETT